MIRPKLRDLNYWNSGARFRLLIKRWVLKLQNRNLGSDSLVSRLQRLSTGVESDDRRAALTPQKWIVDRPSFFVHVVSAPEAAVQSAPTVPLSDRSDRKAHSSHHDTPCILRQVLVQT